MFGCVGWIWLCCSRVSGVFGWVGCSTAVPPQFFTVSQPLLHTATIATSLCYLATTHSVYQLLPGNRSNPLGSEPGTPRCGVWTMRAAWNTPGTLTRTEAFIPPIPPLTTKKTTALDSGASAGLRDQGRAIAMQSRHVAWLGSGLASKASNKPS